MNELLALLPAGVLVNNLFQVDASSWHCSLRDADYGYAMGCGPTWEIAFREAVTHYRFGRKAPLIKQTITARLDPGLTLEDLGL